MLHQLSLSPLNHNFSFSIGLLPSPYKHAAAFFTLNVKKYLWSYIFPQLSLYFCVLLVKETRKMCWYLLHFISSLLYHTIAIQADLSWPLIASTLLNSMINSQFFILLYSEIFDWLGHPPSWNTFFTWLPRHHSLNFLLLLWSLFHFYSFMYHLYNSQTCISSPDFWISLWNPKSYIQSLLNTQYFFWGLRSISKVIGRKSNFYSQTPAIHTSPTLSSIYANITQFFGPHQFLTDSLSPFITVTAFILKCSFFFPA